VYSKNGPKTVKFSLQVGFTGDFVPDCPFKLCSVNSSFDTAFLPDCTKFCTISSGFRIGNLMCIPKMGRKQ